MDEVLLAPTPEQVADAIARAVAGANAKTRTGDTIRPPADALAAAVARAWDEPAGEYLFPGQSGGRRVVAVAWWVDPGRRRHVRVWSYRTDEDDSDDVESDSSVLTPPCCRVYPGSLFAVSVSDGPERLLAACGCGNVGSPETLGWSGDRCGPCADARVEGREVPVPATTYGAGGESAGRQFDWSDPTTPPPATSDLQDLRGGRFTRDRTTWVGLSYWQAFVAVDVASGNTTQLREDVFVGLDTGRYDPSDFSDGLCVIAIDPDHDRVVVALHDDEHGTFGPAHIGSIRNAGGWRSVPYEDHSENQMPRVHGFTPDGAWLLFNAPDGGLTFYPVVPTDSRPAVVAAGLTATGRVSPAAVAFSPDGETLACHVPNIGGLWLLPWKRMLAAVGVTA